MELTGQQLIGFSFSKQGAATFVGISPFTGETLEPLYYGATEHEVGRAFVMAREALEAFRGKKPEEKALFLEHIADEVLALGDDLIRRCMQETALPASLLTAERERTVEQLRLFAAVVREGSWVETRIDTAIPGRLPAPKPDLRQMLIPLGPIGIFGAGNFPFAFSVAAGDTASALAAGCPVVVKAHPSQPGTSEMLGRAVNRAAQATRMPEGVFSMVQGVSRKVGLAMANHPLARGIAFTGSFKGGKAIFDAAVRRPAPIPVFAEMGSANPIFLLPGALVERGNDIADGLVEAVNRGVGQFCTRPGLVLALQSRETEDFIRMTAQKMSTLCGGTMMNQRTAFAYEEGIRRLSEVEGVSVVVRGKPGKGETQGLPYLLRATVDHLMRFPWMAEEVFGPCCLILVAESRVQLMEAASGFGGQLSATVHGTTGELQEYGDLVKTLENHVGRLLFNGFSTGIEVCASVQHGGPFPASTEVRSTSIGTAAIKRFARPLCYQDFPDFALPRELRDDNPLGIFRLVNGQWTRDKIGERV